MENQAVNGVLDLGFCNPLGAKLILPHGVENSATITHSGSVNAVHPLPLGVLAEKK